MRRRRWSIALVAVLIATLAATAWDVRLIVFPTLQRPAPTGVLVLLGGPYRPGELPAARRAHHAAPDAQVLISNPVHQCPRVSATEICFVASPLTTQGEARYAAAWARAHGATSITVVAPQYQASRARLYFRRCWSGDLAVVGGDDGIRARIAQIPYQTGGFLKALLVTRGC